jgi:hypothetical protein
MMRAMNAVVLHLPATRSRRAARDRARSRDAAVVDLVAYRAVIAAGADRWEVRAGEVIDALEQLLVSRHGREVAEFCERAVRLLEDNAAAIHDDDAVRRLAARLGAVHERARRVAR